MGVTEMIYAGRTTYHKLKDFVTFPLRALTTFGGDKWGLSALSSERFDYAAREVRGYCLDVGCGKYNRFITKYLKGNGKGLDVFLADGLSEENVPDDITRFPFPDDFFETVTFIASINHIPSSKRDAELLESFRCLKQGGNIIITMGHPVAELIVHQVIRMYDKVFGTHYDYDSQRGMHPEESYYLEDTEIISRIECSGFRDVTKKYFWTQWWLNHLFVGWKR